MCNFYSRVAAARAVGLVALVLVCITACGGGDNAAAPTTTTTTNVNGGTGTGTVAPITTDTRATLQVSGKVMNIGYLGNTQVCADLNADGLCGVDEASTITDAGGNYALALTDGYRGTSLLAIVRPDSVDSAATTASPILIKQGWVLSSLLEYEDGVTALSLNISPLTTTYYARIRLQGRNRLNNAIAVFTRIVSEPNIDPVTQQPILSVDFDYVTNPRNDMTARLRVMSNVLSAKADAAASPLNMLATTAMHAAWYNTYVAPTATLRSVASDAAKIAAYVATNTSSPAYYIAQDYRYFRPKTAAALRLRDGLTDTAGWLRKVGEGSLASIDRRVMTLANGAIINKLARLVTGGDWESLTVEAPEYFTFDHSGSLAINASTDDLQSRSITFVDGNRLSFKLLNSEARWGFDVTDSPGTSFYIEEWIGEQRDYTTYYNGTVPLVAPLTVKPTCAMASYPGTPQPDSAANLASTSATTWFTTCYNYFTAEYYDVVKHDVALAGVDPQLPGASFYDATLQDTLLVAPVKTNCGSEAVPLAKVTTANKQHCNWAVNANAGHILQDLFATDGVALNSWTKVYGPTAFTTGTVTTTLTAGSAGQLGLPQQLTLKLTRLGGETSGTGTLVSPYGAWTATSNTAVTENIQWEIAADNPNMVLVSWPFRDAGDPRVPSTQATNGSAAIAAPILPAGHFTADWNGNTFSLTPTTRTAPNYRKLAIVLVDGVFVTGQYYGKDYTYSKRYFGIPAMARGIDVLNYVFNRLYQVGFVDL
jgi:hypothetical protein